MRLWPAPRHTRPENRQQAKTVQCQAGHGMRWHLDETPGRTLVGRAGVVPGPQGVEGGAAAAWPGDLERMALGTSPASDRSEKSARLGQPHALDGAEMEQGRPGRLGIIAKAPSWAHGPDRNSSPVRRPLRSRPAGAGPYLAVPGGAHRARQAVIKALTEQLVVEHEGGHHPECGFARCDFRQPEPLPCQPITELRHLQDRCPAPVTACRDAVSCQTRRPP